MRYCVYVCFVLFLATACNQVQDQSDASDSEAGGTVFYGQEFDLDTKEAISVADLMTQMEGKRKQENIRLQGEIIMTCAKKGCWMDMVMPGEHDLKVTFKDYEFFVPTEGQEGKTAILEGMAYVDTLDVDLLRHYAEDAGKSQEEIDLITEPEVVLAFEATGVTIQ